MQVPNEILMKFPVIFREKLMNKEVKLQDKVEFEYKNIYAYRCIKRKKQDYSVVTKDDFKSNAELGRRNIRGEGETLERKPEYYGVSLFQDKTELEMRLKLPKKDRKIAEGNIYQDGGPILRGHNSHICWWLYEDTDISKFKIEDCEG